METTNSKYSNKRVMFDTPGLRDFNIFLSKLTPIFLLSDFFKSDMKVYNATTVPTIPFSKN